jgi:hypothetical protein
MGVNAILTRHYLTEGDQLEITLEAVDVANNRSVWRDTISVAASDKIAMREQITSRVRKRLVPLLGGSSTSGEGETFRASPVVSLDACGRYSLTSVQVCLGWNVRSPSCLLMFGLGSRIGWLLAQAHIFLVAMLATATSPFAVPNDCGTCVLARRGSLGRIVGECERTHKAKCECECCNSSFHVCNPFHSLFDMDSEVVAARCLQVEHHADICFPPVLTADSAIYSTARNAKSRAFWIATFKVYSTLSGRRFMSNLKQAHKRGLISHVPHYNTIFNILGNDDLTPILLSLLERSALPLAPIEEVFAIDSLYLKTTRLIHDVDKNTGELTTDHDHVKSHVMIGVETTIVTAMGIGDRDAYDGSFLGSLLDTTKQRFNVKKVLGDKGYNSRENVELVGSKGALPYIAFPANKTGKGGPWWSKMHAMFLLHREEFDTHYHRRSKIEAAFNAVKRVFAKYLRSRTETAMKNEAICKFLCHNIVVLIHQIHELGIEPEFWPPRSNNSSKIHRVF